MCACNGLPYNCVDCQETKENQEREEALARGEELAQSEYGAERHITEFAGEAALTIIAEIIVGTLNG